MEIKCLLKGEKTAQALVEKLRQLDPNLTELSTHSQLNHYFECGNLDKLYQQVARFLNKTGRSNLKALVARVKTYSLRTRQADDEVRLVVKATVDKDTSANSTTRLEFEAPIPKLSLAELDKLLLDCGFHYQAKWSRRRRNLHYQDIEVAIDKNAGYGYLAEFEKVVGSPRQAKKAKAELHQLIARLGLEELSQDRLERMFAYYNAHWQDYYGTDKVFNIR